MFKIDLSDDYAYPVTLEIRDDKGRVKKEQFTARFKRLPQAELDELMNGAKEGAISDAELAAKVLAGWDGIADSDGEPIPYNDTTREQVLDVFPVRPSIIAAWFESLTGAKRKNSP
jgi:hypothetical protein